MMKEKDDVYHKENDDKPQIRSRQCNTYKWQTNSIKDI